MTIQDRIAQLKARLASSEEDNIALANSFAEERKAYTKSITDACNAEIASLVENRDARIAALQS